MTWHIHIKGQVQGVGFRPFVFLIAKRYGLKGWVNNAFDGVHVVFNASQALALTIKKALVEKAPELSRITSIHLAPTQEKFFDNFQIIHSEKKGVANLLLTPDFALCAACRAELYEAEGRRHTYPFTTCTHCGPRFSIIHQLPYDRENTKMEAFQMCPTCRMEYEDPLDRRYYSQTSSCPDCSIELTWYDAEKKPGEQAPEKVITKVVQAWRAGKIVAIKGIGGYLLTCDAANEQTIQTLRERKYRPSKPFALMYPDVNALGGFERSKEEVEALQSPLAPIVLLHPKESHTHQDGIAPGLDRVGVMLPYTPLYDLLLRRFGRAIIATSANLSNSPIVFQDEKALNELTGVADHILTNNREILVPQDDSLVKFTSWEKQKIILRRSRGMAPTYINAALELPEQSILATGGMLKSTFGFLHQNNIYISQYLGDLEHFDTQQNYQATIDHFLNLFNTQPEVILCDQHPGYPSTQYGEEQSRKWGVPIHPIQHHLAHFGAVLGENNLVHTSAPVLGVIWDGTGLGDDQHIWGGEFFKYENYNFLRCAHFGYFDFILGDKMPKEPRISALSACWGIPGAEVVLKNKFSKTEWQIYTRLMSKENRLKTSSVGRIFDAVAALLGIMDQQSYEGEAAMQLEQMAIPYFQKHGLDHSSSYFAEAINVDRIPTKTLMKKIIEDLQSGESKDSIAAKFHYSLIQLIKNIANNLKIKKLAFSGGVFQNGLLVDLIHYHLKEEFELFFHRELSPNDENISFGQLVCYQIKNHLIKINKSKEHVFSNSGQD